ncbi:hypothetical protein [uncultured Gammaproteobacteria bacterium]|jgi:hypothetical protein|nr:hypothetical protein [uncultured Gammaproteobacteria bacterium]
MPKINTRLLITTTPSGGDNKAINTAKDDLVIAQYFEKD